MISAVRVYIIEMIKTQCRIGVAWILERGDEMDNSFDLSDFLKKIKSGENVKCPVCDQGYMISIEHGYACEYCKTKINEN